MHVLVVGASVAGVATADSLRAEGFGGRITVVDAEEHLPYDKPPLSKAALAPGWDADRGLLRPEEHYRDKRIDLLLGRRVIGLDPDRPRVTLDSGERVAADAVVLAPGLRARELAPESMLPGVWSVRTRADSDGLRAALAGRPRVVVVGAGFIGVEVASVTRSLGCEVSVVEAGRAPFHDLLGEQVATAFARRLTAHGVALHAGVGVDRVHGHGRAEQVVLQDASRLPAEVVVLGLGAEPDLGWLSGSGLDLTDGIVCDAYGRTSVPGVYAVGDAAAWWDPAAARHRRVEHWTTAKDQGAAVGRTIADPDRAPRGVGTVPYFWSDQFGRRMQFIGTSAGHDSVTVVHGDLDTDEFVVLYSRDGMLTGALGLSAARQLMQFRAALARPTTLDSILDSAQSGGGQNP